MNDCSEKIVNIIQFIHVLYVIIRKRKNAKKRVGTLIQNKVKQTVYILIHPLTFLLPMQERSQGNKFLQN